jgi:hypothetical protein
MLKYLRELLEDITHDVVIEKQNEKILALETVIDILEKIREKEEL